MHEEPGRGSRGRWVALTLALAGAVVLVAACDPVYEERPVSPLVGSPAASSQLAGCDRADSVVVATADTHLDPACTYSKGIEVRASGVTLDCQGATIESPAGAGGRGILVATPADVPLHDVVIRNCLVKGFLNSLRVTREGFKSLVAGHEYDTPTSAIVVENSHLYRSRGSGVFVDGYVSGVTLRQLEIAGSGSVGIYLEAGSRDNVVEDNLVYDNGFGDVKPEGVPLEGTNIRYHSTGREGIAVDGSRNNVIRGNRIVHNAAGGIFLYKNCGEYATQKPQGWWTRRYGAEGNLIESNEIGGGSGAGPTGVWVGSRMAENQLFMDCSDPVYVTSASTRIHLDRAAGNVVRDNSITGFTHGVRVEDDGNRIEANRIVGTDPAGEAVLIGTKYRTEVLAQPVAGTEVVDNQSTVDGNPSPYRWIHGHTGTTFSGNQQVDGSQFVPSQLVAGQQPTMNPHLFVIDFWFV